MSERARVKLPDGPFDLELPDGTVLRGAKVIATDRRAAAPDVRIAGTAWADAPSRDEERADAEAKRRAEAEERKARERAEQSARDRRTGDWWNKRAPFDAGDWTFNFDFKSQPFNTEAWDWSREWAGYARTPKPSAQIAGWRTALGFGEQERPSIAEVKRRHRQRMTRAHPDAGGSHEQAVALNRAMDDAKRELRQVAR